MFELEEFIAMLDRLKEADSELSDAQLEHASGGIFDTGDIRTVMGGLSEIGGVVVSYLRYFGGLWVGKAGPV